MKKTQQTTTPNRPTALDCGVILWHYTTPCCSALSQAELLVHTKGARKTSVRVGLQLQDGRSVLEGVSGTFLPGSFSAAQGKYGIGGSGGSYSG